MSRLGRLLGVLGAFGLLGCVSLSSVGRAIPFPRSNLVSSSTHLPDVVVMDIAPLEVPLGDRFVNEDIWTLLDEQILPTKQRLRLEHNGFRVGLAAGGRTPEGLRQLLTSKKSNPKPYQSRRQIGNSSSVALARDIDPCEFEFWLDDRSEPKRYRRAACQFRLVPHVDHEGAVRLQFAPQLEFDDPEKWSRLNPRFALAVQGQRSTETLEPLTFEVTLGDNDFVVVGARFDAPDSMAARFFLSPDPDRPVQRLLAVRAAPLFKNSGTSSGLRQASTHSLAAQAAAQ